MDVLEEAVDDAEEEGEDDNIVKFWAPKAEGRGPTLALSTTVTIGGRDAPVEAAADDPAGAAPAVCPDLCICSRA